MNKMERRKMGNSYFSALFVCRKIWVRSDMGCERLGIVEFLWKSVYKYLKLGETKVEKESESERKRVWRKVLFRFVHLG